MRLYNHFGPIVSKYHMVCQGRQLLPKTGWASSNAAHCRCPVAPYILTKPGGTIAPSAPPPLTPLYAQCCNVCCVITSGQYVTYLCMYFWDVPGSNVFILQGLRTNKDKTNLLVPADLYTQIDTIHTYAHVCATSIHFRALFRLLCV